MWSIGVMAPKGDREERKGGMAQGSSKRRMARLKQMGGEGRGAESRVWEKGRMKEAW